MKTLSSAARRAAINIGTEFFGFYYYWFTQPRGEVDEVL
jgi:hypothetical protein